MAAVHSASTGSNNNDSKNSTHASTHRNGTASPGGWHFPKGGLGTPDLFYSFSGGSSSHGASHMNNAAGGPSGSSSQQQQPAWLKASTGTASPSVNSNSNTVNIAAPRAVSTSAAIKREEAGDNDDDDAKVGDAGDQSSFGGKFARDQEEANRSHRALSDPPVRQSPAWIFPSAGGGGFGPHKTHLEQEPNPFEHSFSVKDSDHSSSAHHQFAQAINAGHAITAAGGNAGQSHSGYPVNAYGNLNNSYEIGPSRRARSQSPKSAGWQHSNINAGHHFNNPYQDQGGYANLFGNTGQGGHGHKNVYGNVSTPSSELPSFGWTFDQQSSSNAHGNAAAGGIFDPTSIRTGLTPGGALDNNKHSQHLQPLHTMQTSNANVGGGAPHSPATQALFAMMTNTTPGAEIGPYNPPSKNELPLSSQHHQPQPAPFSGIQRHQAALGDNSRGSSTNSSSSASQTQQAIGHDGQIVYSQTIPRPLQHIGQYGNNGHQQHPQTQYHAGNPAYLQQAIPRPMPPRAFDSTQSSEASSSQSVPQLQQQQQRQQQGAQRVGGTDQNPLYLLSQHAQDGQAPQSIPPNVVQRLQGQGNQRHLSDPQAGASNSHNEDAMLAAAALSGLSTPRPAYVGGPAPTNINPGTINTSQSVPNLVQPPPGRQQQQQQGAGKPLPPPANLFHTQKPSTDALTKENMKANNKANSTKKAGGNKRKKGNTATPEPTAIGGEESKKVRRTSRRNVASSNLAEPQSEDENDPLQSQMQLQRDMYNEDHSFNRSIGVGSGGDMMGGFSDDDDDMMSNNGSLNGSRDGMGGSQAGDGTGVSPPRKGGRGPKQHFATEEDKRKNFLERNRQAALKCRQRKKQWLTQLQSKVQYLTQDNETLQATVARLREEVANLRAVLGVHGDCQMNVPPGPTGPGGVTTVGAYMHGVQQQGLPPNQQQHPHRQY